MGLSTRSKFLKRFELHQLFNNHLATYEHIERDIKKCMNIILSQMTSVNHQVSEVHHFNLIRLYLIKSYRGKAQAIGKPCRGQRTWSNAWTAYNYNKIIRNYIVVIQRNLNKDKKVEKINYKVLKKKLKKSTKPKVAKQPKKKTHDFKLIYQFFMKTLFSEKVVYTPNLIPNENQAWIYTPTCTETNPPLVQPDLITGYNTKVWIDFYLLPNLFLLHFYSKNFYIFAPSMKITNIFNLFTWLNFNQRFLKTTSLKDFLPLFLFPKLKKSVRKSRILYGSGVYRRPYKSFSNFYKILKKNKITRGFKISPLGNYLIHNQFLKYFPLLSYNTYKLKTPQIQAVSEAFEQPSLTLFFKNPTFKKVYKTKKFLFEKKKIVIDELYF